MTTETRKHLAQMIVNFLEMLDNPVLQMEAERLGITPKQMLAASMTEKIGLDFDVAMRGERQAAKQPHPL